MASLGVGPTGGSSALGFRRVLCRVPVVERWVVVKMMKRDRLVAIVQGMVVERLVEWQVEIRPLV